MGSDSARLRSNVEFFNHQLLNAEMELDAIWRTVALAEANIQWIVNKRDENSSLIRKKHGTRHLPTEIVFKVADYLRWERQYDRSLDLDGPSYSSLRTMAKAFSMVKGMEQAILRKIPLALFVNEALEPSAVQEIWEDILNEMPPSQREVIGLNPRFCCIEDEDTIAQIIPHEEVHLLFVTDRYVSKVTSETLVKFVGNLHATVICLSAKDFKDHPGRILRSNFISLMSSVTVLLPGLPSSRAPPWKTKIGAALTFPNQTRSALKRANLPFYMLRVPGRNPSPIPQSVTAIEIHNSSSITVEDLEHLNLAKLLQPLRTSLRSLHFSNPGKHWDLVPLDFEKTASGIVMDFPCLQELRFESINDFDMYGVMVLGNFDCPSLISLVIRAHYVSPESYRAPNLLKKSSGENLCQMRGTATAHLYADVRRI